MIAALHNSRAFDRPLYLLICGEGIERGALEEKARALGVGDRVLLPGWIDELAEYYRLFDVFCLTSLSEGASVSLLEAMACGIVPVVMDVGGNRDILGEGLRSQVVPNDDVPAFQRALLETLESPRRLKQLGVAARSRVIRHYGVDRMLARYGRVYRGLMP